MTKKDIQDGEIVMSSSIAQCLNQKEIRSFITKTEIQRILEKAI